MADKKNTKPKIHPKALAELSRLVGISRAGVHSMALGQKLPDFSSIDDVEESTGILALFAAQAVSGPRPFIHDLLSRNLSSDDLDNLFDVAASVDPTLLEKLINFSKFLGGGYAPKDRAEMWEVVVDTRYVYMAMGMFIGGWIADRSGKSLLAVSEAWVKATLAQPRYQNLISRSNKRKSRVAKK